jgi:hypothetical protein
MCDALAMSWSAVIVKIVEDTTEAFAMKVHREWLSWGADHLFLKLAGIVRAEEAAVAEMKRCKVKTRKVLEAVASKAKHLEEAEEARSA